MKFMKLGSKPDAFQADGNTIRFMSSELATDVVINVGEVKFFLHKFPLLSKSNCLQKLSLKSNEETSDEIYLPDLPGGPKAFEICAKFCYGVTVTLNAYNVVAARCAAEYLEMTEDVDQGNLIFKIEVFLNSSVFHSWKDSIFLLQTTPSLLPWSEDLKVVGRCIDSIASKTSVDPSLIKWSYTYNRKLLVPDRIVDNGVLKIESVPRDWWVEDICELGIDLFERVMTVVKSKGRMDGKVIGEALKTYIVRWLPGSVDSLASEVHNRRNKKLVETVISLLPSDGGVGCSCSFLLKLLKCAILVGADDTFREDLVKRISSKLDKASVNDLLIPARSPQTAKYDVELVQTLVNQYMQHGKSMMLSVGKLVDGYLAEIAYDPNLSFSSFVLLSQSVPESARPIHDGLYSAIDIYLKEHPNLTKSERKKICGLMDVKKLTMDASTHAAQNELLPLRVVVQVLYTEQLRAAVGVHSHTSDSQENSSSTTKTEEDWEKKLPDEGKSLEKQMSQVKMTDGEIPRKGKLAKGSKNTGSGIQLLPSRSRRIFDKLWVVRKGHGNGENRSSETSGSSQSPTSVVQGKTKSSDSSSRHRRYSVS
ncbi:hypothetical protein RHSIM_Rhsim07G0165300 [Rhododendron simsii]|uniref:Phototropic-responsive NPH3 family protein n=1 Tax=Rhododendron simsii TaxID=118357 RepID=A0A834GNV3_RHOSS|nr:hypothetical protein RHSIM_Rhsim07G0165300 [Rhododendron simsii]